MRIGYACLTAGNRNMDYKTCVQRNASPQRLDELIGHNLEILDRMLTYNRESNIRLFRVSSDIIPFGSSPVNTLTWWERFSPQLRDIGRKSRDAGMRLSMHPGQYTVLNSPNGDTVANAVRDLEYHCRFLDSLELGREHKIILHIGGGYGDKLAAARRFVEEYGKLASNIRERLVIENDDRIYTVEEVLEISAQTGAPVIFDNLHHQINPPQVQRDEMEWLEACGKTWRTEDGPQKIHYSQQAPDRKPGSHSDSIRLRSFLDFHSRLPAGEIDIMLEVKDKNLSAVKCVLATSHCPRIKELEREWSRYKYTVLEREPGAYRQIRQLLKNKEDCPVLAFYDLLEQALTEPVSRGNAVNAAEHVWGYFKKKATRREQEQYRARLSALEAEEGALRQLKRFLLRLSEQYDESYLLQSLYFYF